METTNKLVAGLIGVVVVIVCIGAVLVPVLNETVANGMMVKTDFSNGENYAEYSTEDAVFTALRDSDGVTVTYNGEEMTAHGAFYVVSDAFYIFSTSPTYLGIGYHSLQINGTEDVTYTITISNGTATLNNGNTDIVSTPCSGYYYATDEVTDYVFNTASTQSYANDISDLFYVFCTGGSYYCLSDGVLYVNGTETACTIEGIDAVSGYSDLVRTTSGGPTVDINGNEVTLAYTYIAPAEVTGTSTTATADGQLVLVIPVLVIIALILGVVALANGKTRE